MKVTLHSVIPERQVGNWEGVFEDLWAERFPRALQWSGEPRRCPRPGLYRRSKATASSTAPSSSPGLCAAAGIVRCRPRAGR